MLDMHLMASFTNRTVTVYRRDTACFTRVDTDGVEAHGCTSRNIAHRMQTPQTTASAIAAAALE